MINKNKTIVPLIHIDLSLNLLFQKKRQLLSSKDNYVDSISSAVIKTNKYLIKVFTKYKKKKFYLYLSEISRIFMNQQKIVIVIYIKNIYIYIYI